MYKGVIAIATTTVFLKIKKCLYILLIELNEQQYVIVIIDLLK